MSWYLVGWAAAPWCIYLCAVVAMYMSLMSKHNVTGLSLNVTSASALCFYTTCLLVLETQQYVLLFWWWLVFPRSVSRVLYKKLDEFMLWLCFICLFLKDVSCHVLQQLGYGCYKNSRVFACFLPNVVLLQAHCRWCQTQQITRLRSLLTAWSKVMLLVCQSMASGP